MILYHGSTQIIEAPAFGKGSSTNDYGRGFYCTESPDLAKEWACPEVRNGFSNKYEFDFSGLSVLKLNGNGYHILNWIAMLLNNRFFSKRSPIARQASEYILDEFLPDITGVDVICGYRADDSYFSYAKDFLNNTISVQQLSRAMKLGELGEQVVLISPKSFEQIHFLGYEIADAGIYYYRRAERENKARQVYLNDHGTDFKVSQSDLYVRDILQRRIRNDDQCLR